MRHLTIFLLFVLGFSSHLRGEDPILLGFKGALNSLKSVPDEIERDACNTAAKVLRPYLKPTTGGFHCRSRNTWFEIKELRVRTVNLGVVSEADRANGITDRLAVHYTASMHRSQRGEEPWTAWRNSLPGTFPSIIRVERTHGVWSGQASLLALLTPCNDQPISIPRPAAAASPQPSVTPTPRATTRTPERTSTKQSTTPAPKAEPTQAEAFQKAVVSGLISNLLKLGLPILGIFLLLALAKRLIRSSRRRTGPPKLPRQRFTPPPMPTKGRTTPPDPLDLVTRRDTLMTPAEQKFYAVLESVTSPTCRISSKVRMADLFDVLYAPGHQAAFNKIRSKHIDFVLTEPGSSRILCGIELDDRSHQRPDRIERDAFVNQLFKSKNLPLLRVPWARSYSPEVLRQSLTRLLGNQLAA